MTYASPTLTDAYVFAYNISLLIFLFQVFRQGRNLESEDSSYDSDYETTAESVGTPQGDPGHHDDVSRTVSDTLAAEFAEYVTRPNPDEQARELDAILADPNYTSRVEFALKLGYTESQVQVALQKLGPQPSQNELLSELIKLGASSSGLYQQSPKDRSEEIASELESLEITSEQNLDDPSNLRHIVIDGSNVAMRLVPFYITMQSKSYLLSKSSIIRKTDSCFKRVGEGGLLSLSE